MISEHPTLAELGWSNRFQSQLSLEECETHRPVLVTHVHRTHLEVLSPDGPANQPMTPALAEDPVAVGDWLLVAPDRQARRLPRHSVLSRRAAGTEAVEQPIAANVDTLFIVSSCNEDFNIARLERYLAMAHQAEVEPVILLTKADLCDTPETYRKEAEAALRNVIVETLNAKDEATIREQLSVWTKKGRTLAMLGSSGVGKTTLANALTGQAEATQAIREDDSKGRHTTTARSMHRLASGGWLVDTPGMRELRLLDAADGIDVVFEDIAALALECRFRDCAHDSEPGCAVQSAIDAGTLDADRLRRWQKLQREDRHNSETVAEAHARSRKLSRQYAQGKKRGEHKRSQ